MSKYKLTLFFIAVLAFVTDQLSKFYIVYVRQMYEGQFVPVIEPLFNLKYVKNFGINFGLLNGNMEVSRWLLTLVTSAIVIGVLFWIMNKLTFRIAVLGGLVVGGALGNIFDRIYHGAVIDFINNSWWGFVNPFSYNLADIWIFIGIFGLIIWGPKEE